MRTNSKTSVPKEFALLYEFLNTADMRIYVENGEPHLRSDQLESATQLHKWLRDHGLLRTGETLNEKEHRRVLELREHLRAFLQLQPEQRPDAQQAIKNLNEVMTFYPLVVTIARSGAFELEPKSVPRGIAPAVAEFFVLAQTGQLDRLKMCSSSECQWIYFDRSKPGNRRWCSSLLCGNRQKTRDYRERLKRMVKGA
ncbi:MAG TPA: CGNR zinc finger domain-containing protein [Verrucomicrobiae bacterium]|nr:CGNR zinc finger domain-containing protein [Verrucomicrobiae bacterium]